MMRGGIIPSSILVLLLAMGLVAANHYQPAEATITVQASQVLAPVSPLLFGQNFGPWMNTTPEYVAMYKKAGVTLLRFPAGNYGDENDLYPNNLDDLAALARELQAEVVVQARLWRQGSPEKAAGLVRYCNLENDYGFRYWEVGNEPDLYEGTNRYKRAGDPVFDVDWYNARFREFATAMKAIDPTIMVVGPAVTGGWPEWMPAFIQANGDIVDVLSWHWYGHGDELSDAAALATPAEVERQIEAIRSMWVDPEINPLGYQRPLPPLFLSEYNISWSTRVRRHLGSQVGALWNAEVVGRLANKGVEMGAHFALQGTDWQGLVGMLADERPVKGVYQLYSRWGTEQVAATSSAEALLPVFASRHADGRLSILVINKDPQRPIRGSVKLEGYRPSGQARLWQQDEDNLVKELPAFQAAEEFSYTFPPYTVTLIELEPAPAFNHWLIGILGGGLVVLLISILRIRISTVLKRQELNHEGQVHQGRESF